MNNYLSHIFTYALNRGFNIKIINKFLTLNLFVDGVIDADDFHKTKNRYQNNLEEMKTKGEQCNKQSEIIETHKKGLSKLEGINNLFDKAKINEKRQLIGSIFPEKFQFKKNEVRTADINPILLKIPSVNKGYKGNYKDPDRHSKTLREYLYMIH